MDGWQDISRFGKKVVASGLTTSRFGNISVRLDDGILITRTGSMLDELGASEVVQIERGPCPADALASCEAPVHRAIYDLAGASAIIHTHSPYAVAISLIEPGPIEPVDSEGCAMLGEMPVIEGRFGSLELATRAAAALAAHRACIARGHGVFARGVNLLDAYTAVCMAEHSSRVRYLVLLLEHRKG